MKLAIIGNYGASNVGDDAILLSILTRHRGHEWTVFSADPARTAADFHVKTAPLFPFGVRSLFRHGFVRPWRALCAAEAVVLGGGGLFQDKKPMAVLLWAWQLFFVHLLGKPLFVYATGVGPLKARWARRLTAWAYGRASVIAVRDKTSEALLRDIGLTEGEIHVTADPAALFKIAERTPERKLHRCVISLRPWMQHNKNIVESFAEFLQQWSEKKHCSFLFVCMQGVREHDYKILHPLIKKTGGDIVTPKSFSELIALLQTAEFAIGMRLHFLIACLISETPVLPISYGPKIDALFSGTPLARHVLPVEKISPSALDESLKRLSADYNNVKVYERRRTEALREAAQKTGALFDRFIADLQESIDEPAKAS